MHLSSPSFSGQGTLLPGIMTGRCDRDAFSSDYNPGIRPKGSGARAICLLVPKPAAILRTPSRGLEDFATLDYFARNDAGEHTASKSILTLLCFSWLSAGPRPTAHAVLSTPFALTFRLNPFCTVFSLGVVIPNRNDCFYSGLGAGWFGSAGSRKPERKV